MEPPNYLGLRSAVAGYYAARAREYDLSAGYCDPVAGKARGPLKALFKEAMKDHDILEIACGTGYWTEVVAQVASSVLATDVNGSMLALARQRLVRFGNVRFQVADAYSLKGVPCGFAAAFAVWWWSHVPRQLIPKFLATLHRRLVPGARVLFVDQLTSAYKPANKRMDANGNTTEERRLADGRTFRIVKNFPTQGEISGALAGAAVDIHYHDFPRECSWIVSYRVHRV